MKGHQSAGLESTFQPDKAIQTFILRLKEGPIALLSTPKQYFLLNGTYCIYSNSATVILDYSLLSFYWNGTSLFNV